MEILARAVGRRKEAVAQVQLVRGNGQFLINDKPAQTYLQNNSCSLICIKSPLQAALSVFPSEEASPLSTEPSSLISDGLMEAAGDSELKGAPSSPPALHPFDGQGRPTSPSDTLGGQSEAMEGALVNSSVLEGSTSLSPNEAIFKWEGPSQEGEIDIIVKVKGGGLIGQAEAIKLGVARAFCIMENAYGGAILRKILKTKGYLTQDSRVKERKKYGLKKARKASQYHKR